MIQTEKGKKARLVAASISLINKKSANLNWFFLTCGWFLCNSGTEVDFGLSAVSTANVKQRIKQPSLEPVVASTVLYSLSGMRNLNCDLCDFCD